jgi:hypothetical protein
MKVSSSLTAAIAALALAAIFAGTSNNTVNPLAPDQTAVGDFSADNCTIERNVYDRHGNSLGRAMVNACK